MAVLLQSTDSTISTSILFSIVSLSWINLDLLRMLEAEGKRFFCGFCIGHDSLCRTLFDSHCYSLLSTDTKVEPIRHFGCRLLYFPTSALLSAGISQHRPKISHLLPSQLGAPLVLFHASVSTISALLPNYVCWFALCVGAAIGDSIVSISPRIGK